MVIESREVDGNGCEENFAECPVCGQKLLNAIDLKGKAKVVVKCRRCRNFIEIHLMP